MSHNDNNSGIINEQFSGLPIDFDRSGNEKQS